MADLIIMTFHAVIIAASLFLVIAALALFVWSRGIHQRAVRHTARKQGVSEAYVSAVVANMQALGSGAIDATEWERRALVIAYKHPVDSGVRESLLEQEGVKEG